MQLHKLFIFGISALLLNSCDKQKEILKGERESVLKIEAPLKEETIDVPVTLPMTQALTQWPQPYGPLLHGVSPLYIKDTLQKDAEKSVDMGIYPQLLAEPVSDGKCLYVMDGRGKVSAYSLSDTEMLSVKWEFSIVPEKANAPALGGGISCDETWVYIGSPYGELICLNSATGDVQWRRNIRTPLRIAPVLKGKYGVALTINNEVEAFDLSTGKHLWTHKGMTDAAGLLKTNLPVISENVVVVVYSSGEMYALRLENGHPLWAYSLSSGRRFDARSLLMPVTAHFIIHKGYVFVSSQNSKLSCVHLRSGKKVWEKNISQINEPIIAGDQIYLIGNQQHLMCLQAHTGKLIWTKPLHSSQENTQWGRPIILNDQVFISNTNGKGSYYSAIDGHWIKDMELPGPTFASPLVFDEKMFFVSNDGILSVWK